MRESDHDIAIKMTRSLIMMGRVVKVEKYTPQYIQTIIYHLTKPTQVTFYETKMVS